MTLKSKKSINSKVTKKSLSQVENMDIIFNKPADERDKSEKDKIVQYLNKGVNFFKSIQIPLLLVLSDKLEPLSFEKGKMSKYIKTY